MSDGDSKAFKAVQENRLYCNRFKFKRLRYINHYSKRVGAKLRRLKAKNNFIQIKIIKDGKKTEKRIKLFGVNGINDKVIFKIQMYFYKATFVPVEKDYIPGNFD